MSSNLQCTIILIYEARRGLCNQKAIGKQGTSEGGTRWGKQVELGMSSAHAGQDNSIGIINLERAVSEKRLRLAFHEIKSREEGVDREYLHTHNHHQPASMTNIRSFREPARSQKIHLKRAYDGGDKDTGCHGSPEFPCYSQHRWTRICHQ